MQKKKKKRCVWMYCGIARKKQEPMGSRSQRGNQAV